MASFGADADVVAQNTQSKDNDMLYRYMYIEAVRQQDKGNYPLAMELFMKCLELKPDAAEANYAVAAFYQALKQDSVSTEFLQRARELEPENIEFAERLANAYLGQDKIADATKVYEQLVKQHPERTDYLELLIRIYNHQHDYDNVLSALNRLELQEGQSEEITLSKMQAYSYMGDENGAYKELKSLVDAHPNDMNLQVMMGNWLLSNGKKDDALKTFLGVLKEEPDNAQGQMSLMDYYRMQGNTSKADSLLQDILINPRTEPNTRVAMIREWVKDSEEKGGDSLRVMQIFNKVLSLPQKTSEVAEMKVAYMTLKKAPQDSIRAGWEKVLEITPEYTSARLQLIQILWRDTIDMKVVAECKKAVEYVTDEPMLYYYLGVAQYLNNLQDDAVESLRKGAGRLTPDTDKNVAADIYQMLGDIYQKQHKLKEAYTAYDSCLVYNPDKVVCLNNYAYFLSLEKKELKKAEQMSYRAITAEPNSATYLDTYAWILYQQQRYEEACIYIEQAMKHDTDTLDLSGDIYEHAGDIYMQLKRTEEAVKMWEKALKLGVEDEATLRKKLKRKL